MQISFSDASTLQIKGPLPDFAPTILDMLQSSDFYRAQNY